MARTGTPAIDRSKLKAAIAVEDRRFIETHPRSGEMFQRAREHLLGGVPMNWMIKWASPYPVFVREASGAHFEDVDGNRYIDLCLGDTGAMTGHAPAASVKAIERQLRQGITYMLPTEDSLAVGAELSARFGLPYWQFALTATDANRFALRLARQLTKRPYVLVFNWCYHGTVDESFITLTDGRPHARSGNCGPAVDPVTTTKVVEFNDQAALESALAPGDVACVLAEPVMTNIGIVHPQPGFHQYLREVTLGKPIASGIPAAVYGVSAEVAERVRESTSVADCDTSGIGGTLAGNALSLAAMRATLEEVLTADAYKRTIPLAGRFVEGVERVVAEHRLPWIVKQLGCRAEYWFRETPPKNGGEAAAAADFDLDRYMHLAALNRGVLMTPFHNMALISPVTTEADIDRHTEVFSESVRALI